jgi:hypothetical protein
MPFKGSNSWNVDKDVFARFEGKMWRSTNYQRNDARGKHNTSGYPTFALLKMFEEKT